MPNEPHPDHFKLGVLLMSSHTTGIREPSSTTGTTCSFVSSGELPHLHLVKPVASSVIVEAVEGDQD